VTVDAGSSHSEVQVWSWSSTPINVSSPVEEVPIVQQEGGTCSAKPGISSFADNPAAAAESLKFCLGNASLSVPKSQLGSTEVMLRATAGMRVLNEENPTAAAAVLDAVRNASVAAGFSPSSSASILSGTMEGAYGWITANYANNTVGFNVPAHSNGQTLGALDMGGASTQISFQVAADTSIKAEDTFHMRLFGLDDVVYTHSYLCYGMNAATDRVLASSLPPSLQPVNNKITAPVYCWPTGYTQTVTDSQLGDWAVGYCTSDISTWQPSQSPNGSKVTVELEGRSAFSTCEDSVMDLLLEQKLPGPPGNQPALPDGITYLAFSGYFHVVDFSCTNLDGSGSTVRVCQSGPGGDGWLLTPGALRGFAQELCELTLVELRATVKSGSVPDQYLAAYCFQATYLHKILAAYGFADDSVAVHFVDQINGRDAGQSGGRRPAGQGSDGHLQLVLTLL